MQNKFIFVLCNNAFGQNGILSIEIAGLVCRFFFTFMFV